MKRGMNHILIKAQDLTKIYHLGGQEIRALDRVSFQVNDEPHPLAVSGIFFFDNHLLILHPGVHNRDQKSIQDYTKPFERTGGTPWINRGLKDRSIPRPTAS